MWVDYLFWVGVGLVILYEVITFEQKKGETISEITWRIVSTHPLIPLLVGILMGHLFWQSSSIYSK
jgi:hypothetical protein